jgi:hypothetical protein
MRIQDHRKYKLCNRFLRYELLDILNRVFVNVLERIEWVQILS